MTNKHNWPATHTHTHKAWSLLDDAGGSYRDSKPRGINCDPHDQKSFFEFACFFVINRRWFSHVCWGKKHQSSHNPASLNQRFPRSVRSPEAFFHTSPAKIPIFRRQRCYISNLAWQRTNVMFCRGVWNQRVSRHHVHLVSPLSGHLEVSVNGGSSKWMVDFRENPIVRNGWLGVTLF